MAEKIWNEKIDRHVDWGGCEATNNLPVSGAVVQDFIKSELNSRIGHIYHDTITSQYLCFATEEDKEVFLKDPSKTELILGTFEAPSSYVAEIITERPYKAILIGQNENYLNFAYKITNNGSEYPDSIRYTISVNKNGNVTTINGEGTYGKEIKLNVDEYLTSEGIVEFSIKITGKTTGVSASTMMTYEVVNLTFTSTCDISKIYDLTQDVIDPLVIRYSIFGTSNIKYIDWYIDGKFHSTDVIQGGTVEVLSDNKNISVVECTHGVHNVQFMAYVIVNGEKFYTDTIYKEFFVIRDSENKTPMISYETVIPRQYGVVTSPKIYNVIQYEPYTISYAVYNPGNLATIPVDIHIDNVLMQTVQAPNFKVLNYSFVSNTDGNKVLKFVTGQYSREIGIDVDQTIMDLQEITNNLVLKLTATGRTNEDVNRNQWSFNGYNTTFTGFNWSKVSGWNDNRLVLSDKMSIETNISPLAQTSNGKTIEVEFETINVTDDDAILCDLRNSNGLGLLITASKASLIVGTEKKQVVSTNFKANENIRLSFVIDSVNKLALIYVNGVVSGAVAIKNISININKYLKFTGSSGAGIRLKQILIFNTQLSAEQILNNYILYRDTVAEMKQLYNANDVLDGKFMSVEKISNFIPVILLTGEQIFWLESQKDTDIEIAIDVEYINKQHPEYQFKWKGGCCRIQGTSSAGYVRKNWRLYSKRKKRYIADVWDWQGVLLTDEERRIAFKPGAIPVNCWTLKADYAESSGTHNTGVATLWNHVMYNAHHPTNGYVCRTNAQIAALENKYEYDVRTTVDGFPIAVFARRSEDEDYIFMGKYNFNNDKSTENVFGFCDIPGFDDQFIPGHEGETIPEGEFNSGKDYTYGNKMQCWEMCENYDTYALFKTTEGWDNPQIDEATGLERVDEDGVVIKNWATGFEARYPDDANEADTSDLKAFANWLISCGDDHEKFAIEKYDHFDLWKVAAYYVYLMRFGAVDQPVKNSMLTSEDGKHWYYINYDNDTIIGLDNAGALVYPPTITRDTKSGVAYAYAGRESRLWNMLEADTEFMTYYVPEVDNALFSGGLSYSTALQYFNTNQSDKWCENIYNSDAEYKYIKPYVAGSVDELGKMHGSRKSHRTWWLSKRFQLMDAKFGNDNYKEKFVRLLLEGSPGVNFTIKASDYMYFGCEYNKNPLVMGVELEKGETYTFKKPSTAEDPEHGKDFAMGDPLYIYSPLYIEELDLSKVSEYIYQLEFGRLVDDVTSARMRKLIIGGKKTAKSMNALSGIEVLTNLEYLDLTGVWYHTVDFSTLTLLKKLIATGSTIQQFHLADGGVIDTLALSENTQSISFKNLPNLTWAGITDFDTQHIPNIEIIGTPQLTNSFGVFRDWAREHRDGDSLKLSGFEWTEVPITQLIEFGENLQNIDYHLQGRVTIPQPSLDEVEQLQRLFGDNCFTNNGAFWISAPDCIFVHGKTEIRSGDSQIFSTTIFSQYIGTVRWEISEGKEFVSKVEPILDENGVATKCRVTTVEDETGDHDIIVKASHTPKNDQITLKFYNFPFVSKRTVYANTGVISGNPTIQKTTQFSLSLNNSLFGYYNGDFTTKWSLHDTNGDAVEAGNIVISNSTNTTCTIDYVNTTIFSLGELVATITNKNQSVFEVRLIITVTDSTVLMTSTSNPEVIAICYEKGWCKSPDVMYKREAQAVEDIGDAFRGGSVGEKPRPGSFIKTFEEFEEFTGLKSIPEYAFFQCSNLTKLNLPLSSGSLESIKSFAVAATKVEDILIPSLVQDIAYTAFDGSPIKEFKISDANDYYIAIDGLLVKKSTKQLIKFPEGKKVEIYVIPDTIESLGVWSIKNTSIVNLTINSELSDSCINANKELQCVNYGEKVKADMISVATRDNEILNDLFVVEANPYMQSINGVIYDKQKETLLKYPDGRKEFVIEPVAVIGKDACSYSRIVNIVIPSSVRTIQDRGLYACQQALSFEIADNSILTTIGNAGMQLMSKVTSMAFPESLISLGSSSLSNCFALKEIIFFGKTAPTIYSNTFGTDKTNMSGRDVTSPKYVYTYKDASGFEDSVWLNTIFNPELNNFIHSDTL